MKKGEERKSTVYISVGGSASRGVRPIEASYNSSLRQQTPGEQHHLYRTVAWSSSQRCQTYYDPSVFD
jgi:hypothetical protein